MNRQLRTPTNPGTRTGIELTPDLARRCGQDAANARMRKAGRTEWNEDDFNEASRVTNDLLHRISTNPNH